jgi:hypothetical protein
MAVILSEVSVEEYTMEVAILPLNILLAAAVLDASSFKGSIPI